MSRSLRILMFGFHHVGVAAFHGLREAGHEVSFCFTHSSPPPWIPSLADACAEARVEWSNALPESTDAHRWREQRPDLIVSAGYRRRIGLPFLALPRCGSINAHLAPLPRYRGANPIPWGILHAEPSWGVAIHAMTHNYNEGGILYERAVPLRESDNAYDLLLRSSRAGAEALVDAVNDLATGGGKFTAQDLRGVRFFDAAMPHAGRIDWNQPAALLAAFVRSMDLGRETAEGIYQHFAPPAQAVLNNRSIGVWRARAGGTASPYPPGTLTRLDGEVWVQTGRGHLMIERLCDAQGRDFSAVDYLQDQGIQAGQSFDARPLWRTAESAQLGFAA